jgi:hypothetical protein
MKSRIPALCLALFALSCPLGAEEVVVEEEVIPEVSEPPYEVGDHTTFQGHYIPLEDGISLNFRIVGNLVRIYWVDADDLIVEPQSSKGSLRFRGSIRGRAYHGLVPMTDQAGLVTASGYVLTPHIFNVIMNLEPLEGEGLNNYTFRYLPPMDAIRETRELEPSSTD